MLRFFSFADNLKSMLLFEENEAEFLRRSLFEKALLTAWGNQKFTTIRIDGKWVNWNSFMRERLLRANRAKLIEHSDPLPSGDALTVFRGVGGREEFQRVRGVSWSLSATVARFFAQDCSRPALYRSTVERSDVFAYINESGRREKEVLLVLDEKHSVEELPADPRSS
ncbi:MAG: hypothetical protein WA853_20475 [Candidatus Acidiferrum sp.]